MSKKDTTKKIHQLSIFIFRRDLRLEDNTGLFHALRLSEQVVPCFIFDTDQIDPKRNDYFSSNCVQFMIESLKEVNHDLKKHKSRIFFFHGEKKKVFQDVLTHIKPNAVFINEDYTAYSKQRDQILENLCKEHGGTFYSYHDYTILPKDKVMIPNKGFYQKFTAYYNLAMQYPVREPEENCYTNYFPGSESFKGEFDEKDMDQFYEKNDKIEVHGGRSNGLKILDNMKKWKDYDKKRDLVAYPTTKLSAYNKFGCVSIREVYYAIKKTLGTKCELLRQLFWRDFYYYVAYYSPHVFGDAFRESYQNAYFNGSDELFNKWKEGKTGCPIVDAAMRQLNTEGYMTNRLRLVTSNYLIKDLLVDWRKGERYFATKLVDYDPSQNNGNWQWSAGCGADAQPYFRIFNPKLQSEKYDKDCKFIFEWVPELKGVEPKHIHHWDEYYKQYKGKTKYVDPVVIHDVQKKKCLNMYKQGLSGEGIEEEKEEEKEEESEIEVEEDGVMGEEETVKGKTEKKLDKKRKAEQRMNDELKKMRLNDDNEEESDDSEDDSDKMEEEKPRGRSKSTNNKKRSTSGKSVSVGKGKKGKKGGKSKPKRKVTPIKIELRKNK